MVKEYFEVHNNNMDKNQHGQPVGEKDTPAQAYDTNQYQPNNMIAPTYPSTQAASLSASSSYLREQQHAHHYIHQELQQQLNNFWANQYKEIEETTDFRNHSLPLARIKKIMKANEDVRMVSAEAPVIFAKACEMFIMELTMRARVNAEENKRRTVQNNDIAAAITGTDVFDFLVDVVSRDSTMDHDVYADIPRGGSAPIENVPHYYMPQHVTGPSYGAPRVVTGWPVPDQAHYGQQTHPFAAQICPKQENHSSKSGD